MLIEITKKVEYRPFESILELIRYSECIVPKAGERPVGTMPFVWVRHKKNGNIFMITGFLNNGVFLDTFYKFEELLEKLIG